MANNFDEKDYSEYLKALEQRFSGSIENSVSESEKRTPKASEKRRIRGAVIRIRPISALCVLFSIILIVVAAIKVSEVKPSGKKNSSQSAKVTESGINKENKKPNIAYSINDTTQQIPVENDAEAAIIVRTDTNEVVAERNSDKRMYPASTTKILTLLTAIENIENYDETFTMTLDITDPLFVEGATVAGFLSGEVIPVIDLMYGTILPSGGDAAIGLATKISGSEQAFVKLMNKKVKSLGLKNTHFTNVTGLFDKEHYTTAYDMAVILNEALANPLCKKILSTYQYKANSTPQHPEGLLMSATIFEYMYGTEPETATIMGGKTGFVNESGYCIASYGKSNSTDTQYIIITLKNSSRGSAFRGQIDLYKQFAK